MTVLPIVGRELRVASRRAGTGWWRVASGAVALVIFALVFVEASGTAPQVMGQTLFRAVGICFLVVSLLVGVIYTADALSEERREGTLGLLFLTDLRGYDVVLGKLVASSLGAVYGLLAAFPVMAIPLLIGGVTLAEFGRLALVLLNTAFFSLSLGMLVSSMVRHGLWAMGLTLLLVVAANVVGPVLAVYIAWETQANEIPEPLLIPSAGYALALACFEGLYRRQPEGFWMSLGWLHGLGWLCLFYACVRTRYGWREPIGAEAGGWRRLWVRMTRGGAGAALRLRRELLEVNPCLWLAGRAKLKPVLVWLFLGMTGMLWMSGWWKWGQDWSSDGLSAVVLAMVWHTVLRWWLAAEAVQCFGPDLRSGALELLLTTPLSIREIVRGRLLALQRQFFLPSLVVVTLDAVLLSVSARSSMGSDAQWWSWFCASLAVIFLVDMVALAFLGMWLGVIRRQARWALLGTGAVVFGLPWAIFLGLLFLAAMARIRFPEPEIGSTLAAYVVPSLAVSIAAAVRARGRLFGELRRVAAARFDPGRSKAALVS